MLLCLGCWWFGADILHPNTLCTSPNFLFFSQFLYASGRLFQRRFPGLAWSRRLSPALASSRCSAPVPGAPGCSSFPAFLPSSPLALQQPGGLSTWARGSCLQGICPQPDFPSTCPHPAFPSCFGESCPTLTAPQWPKQKPASPSTSLSSLPHAGVTFEGQGATGFTHSFDTLSDATKHGPMP